MGTPSTASLITRMGAPHPPVPPHDAQAFTYVGGGAANDDNVATITFLRAGNIVAVMTYTYAGATNNIATATLTVP